MADLNGKLYKSGYSGLTYSDIAAFLAKTLSAPEQAVVTALIADIEDVLCRSCRRNFFIPDGTTDSYYETVDSGQETLRLYNLPIKEIVKFTIDDDLDLYVKGDSDNEYRLGRDFFVYEDKVVFATVPYSSIDDRRALTIHYTIEQFWGNDVKLAIKRWVSELFITREYGSNAVSRINVQGFLMDFNTSDLPNFVQSVVDSYRRVRL